MLGPMMFDPFGAFAAFTQMMDVWSPPKSSAAPPQKPARPSHALGLPARSEEPFVAATRATLLRATTALTKISTACQNFCAGLSHAFAVARLMESATAFMRPFLPPQPAASQAYAPWASAPSPWIAFWWCAPAASVQNAAWRAPTRQDLDQGVAAAFCALAVAAAARYATEAGASFRV
ncbi:MAG: hypothetical protein NW215_10365 [Hyphomicrobiales bacterium]|nr:hypothetical protein [Hyphomicrobiales bacterium]